MKDLEEGLMNNVRPQTSTDSREGACRRPALALALLATMVLATGAAPAQESTGRSDRQGRDDPGAQAPSQQAQELQVLRGAEHGAPVTPFLFEGDLRDLPRPVQWRPGDPVKEIPRRHYPDPNGQASSSLPENPGPDPLLAQQAAAPSNTSRTFTETSRNFAGQGYTGVNPPDTVGDVGPDHYIQMINHSSGSQVRIWDKSTPTPTELTTFMLDSLGTGNCASGKGDPVVLYDRLVDRWMLSEFSNSGNYLCVYISQTGDPINGGWYNYNFQAPTFPDYPKYGVWPTDANNGDGSYVVTANDGGPGVYALDRGKMLAGEAASYQRFTISNLPGFSFEAPTPADLDGPNPPPDGAAAIIMRHRDTEVHSGPSAPGDLLEMWLFDVDWVDAGNTTLTQQASVDVAEFDSSLCGLTSFSCFDQPGGGSDLDPLREVIMFRLQYRNSDEFGETLAGNFVVDVDGDDHGGLRWFELRGGNEGWHLYQEGTFAPDSDNRFMASSATDQSGNFAIAYNVSSTSVYPSLRYSGRLADDPLGTLTQGDLSIHEGSARNSSNRYGDYSAMSVDPADDCTFWFTGMDNTSSSWRTQVASFAFDACGCELRPSALVVGADAVADNEIEVSWNDADLETVIAYTVHRSRTPGGPYDLIATVDDTSPGFAGGPDIFFIDTAVSGGVDYYYTVRATDGESCKSENSNEASATATGACTLEPLFDGLQSVTAPALNSCTLELLWAPATDECGGPMTYNIYRSTQIGFQPGASNLIASGLTATAYSDFDQLVDGTVYRYIVRAVDQSNGKEEQNTVRHTGVPQGPSGLCTTISACSDNPYVDVQPDGLVDACSASGFALTAVPNGGTGPFVYQWTRDGVDIPGANSAIYQPTDLGSHAYNVKVQSLSCSGYVFDGLDTQINLVDAPFFDGAIRVDNVQAPDCALEVGWNPGTTVCDGPVRYFVFRDTASPVLPTEDNLVAAGVLGTSYTDLDDLASGTTYHYLVRAQDAATGQFDANTIEVSTFPDGPGSGPQAVLDEDFEDPASFADWTVTTGPGIHTCGEWALSSDAAKRPSGGSDSFALADDECGYIFGRTSTTLTSPPVSVTLANMINVTLEYDLWYNHDGDETAKVEVFDGSSWITVWEDANLDVNAHQAIDVTAWAAGNPNFQVRFDYQDATQDKWMAVDNVQVIALVDVQCDTAPAGPAAVPDGGGSSEPLRGARATLSGDSIDVSWDSNSCPAADYNLVYGDLADVATLTTMGGECSLGTSGSFDWTGVPAGNLFFLVVGTDGASTEGSWGRDGNGGERNGMTPSGECATTFKDASQTCP
jgi:hypothetical protein